METNNVVDDEIVVGGDNEESKENWSVVSKLPRTQLVYLEQCLVENNGVDKFHVNNVKSTTENDFDEEDESMVDSNWSFIPQPLPVHIWYDS